MRKNFGAKPYTYPQPVFIVAAYDENNVPNAMNAAWGGICDDYKISLCLSPEHKTVKNILKTKYFTVSMGDAAHIVECDYVGIESGNDVPDKFERAGFHASKAEFVDAPLIDELAIAMECKLVSYDPVSCLMIADIINVSADESVLDENGRVDVRKVDPITFDPFNNTYVRLGDIVGKAFRDGKKLRK